MLILVSSTCAFFLKCANLKDLCLKLLCLLFEVCKLDGSWKYCWFLSKALVPSLKFGISTDLCLKHLCLLWSVQSWRKCAILTDLKNIVDPCLENLCLLFEVCNLNGSLSQALVPSLKCAILKEVCNLDRSKKILLILV